MAVNHQLYLMVQQVTSSANNVVIYAIDTGSAELILIFKGGTRTPVTNPNATWVYSVNDNTIVFNIGGGGMMAFDPLLALEAISVDLNP